MTPYTATPELLRFLITDGLHIILSKKIEDETTTLSLPQYAIEANLSSKELSFWYPIMAKDKVREILLLKPKPKSLYVNAERPEDLKTFLVEVEEDLSDFSHEGLTIKMIADAKHMLTDKTERPFLHKIGLYMRHAEKLRKTQHARIR